MNSLPWAASTLQEQLLLVLWPFLRISALLVVMPIFGAANVPVTVRLLLGLGMAAMLAPLLPPLGDLDPLTATGLLVALQQVLIGVLMGFVLQMVFSTVAQAGEMMALSMGLGFASINDPQNGLQVPMVSQYYVIVATILFLALDGHLALFQLMFDSFSYLPVSADSLSPDSLWGLVQWGATMYRFAVFVALPVVLSMLLINLSLGVMARAAPQLNIIAVGFPIMIMAGMVAMLVTLPGLHAHVERLLTDAYTLMGRFS